MNRWQTSVADDRHSGAVESASHGSTGRRVAGIFGRRKAGRGDRGVTGVEYALIVGCIATASVVGIRSVGESADSTILTAADAIAESSETPSVGSPATTPPTTSTPSSPTTPPNTTPATTTTSSPPATTAPPTTTSPPTTTAPPTTTSPPTTTAPPTTTTTAAPPTTTARPVTASEFTSAYAVKHSDGEKWDANAVLVVRDAMGRALADDDEVTYLIITVKRNKDGELETKTETKKEKVSNGVVTIRAKDNKTDKKDEPEISVRFEVVSVKQDKDTSGTYVWDGATPNVTVWMP